MRIPAIGLIIAAPPDGYPRYRQLLDTDHVEQCGGPRCHQHAERIWFGGDLPAVPCCEACFVESIAEHGDSACGTLARLDGTGIWRPTGQGGDIRAEPYDFDW
jgi:hypothetical protein